MKQINKLFKGLAMTVILLCLSTLSALAQETGNITGTVSDSTETVIGAVVVVEGNTSLGAFTDTDGNFTIKNVKPGTYNILVTYFGYKPLKIENVQVTAGKTVELGEVYMKIDAAESQEVVVVGTKTTNTEAAAVKETKESKQVVNVISAEQISKSQDRDAAQVMQRVPGVTIIDSRFVMIRGLSERYNVVMINDAIAPNTEVERRSFSFDLIPSQMLDRMSVYKSGAADLPGDFAAGVIKVYTKNMPDKNYFNVSLVGGYRNGTTFKDYNTNYTGGTEFLGFGDKSRNLPDNFPSTAYLNSNSVTDAQKQQAALLLPNRFGYKTTSALPDLRLNIDLGRRFTIGNAKVGNVTSLSYSNVYQSQKIERYDYSGYDSTLGKSSLRSQFEDQRTANTVRLGVIHNWSVIFSPRSKVDFKNFFNQQGENETILRSGIQPQDRAGDSLKAYSYRYTGRTIFTSQLGGKHEFNKEKTSFMWNVGYSNITRNVPDWIRFRTFKAMGTNDPYTVIIPSSATLFDAARFNSKLTENVIMTSGALEHKFAKDADSSGISIKAGYYLESRSRDFQARWMSYKSLQSNAANDSLLSLPYDQVFSPQSVGSPDGFKIEDGTNKSDGYTASNQLYAGFASVVIPIRKFNLQTGLRVEAYHQQLSSATNSEKIEIDTFMVTPLPFLNTSYNLTSKSLIRLAYSKTINRAEFRELAPFLFYDFDLNANFVGNPSLKPCNIHNLDLRWEYYPSASEMISVGVFYKRFNNPIEVNSLIGFPRQFTYRNADYATNYGAELEIRKSLDFINAKVIRDLSLLFNGSIINSVVNLGLTGASEINKRALQGQSPYVINTGLYYNLEDKGLSISALYNIFGKRIFIVGDVNNPTIYEMPRHSIDLTVQKKFSDHWEGRFGIQDLLNYKTRFMQDTNGDTKITSSDDPFITTRRGTYFTLGIQYRF